MAGVKKLSSANVEFRVPWGHVAGKKWGDPSNQRVLAVHGLLDTCEAFDRLISLLHGDYYIVAIDLPGHGHSSHFPAGVPIEFLNFVLAIVYAAKELGWKRFSYVGHSLGAQIGMFFAAIFPEYVEKLMVIDHVSPLYLDNPVETARHFLKEFMVIHDQVQNRNPPVYSYEQALEKFMYRDSNLTEEAAKIVLKRSLKETVGGFTMRMDSRLKQGRFLQITVHLVEDVVRNVECPTLFVFSTERYHFYKEAFGEIFKYVLEKLNFTIDIVEGNHDLHQNNPESIVEFVDKFLSPQKCKL